MMDAKILELHRRARVVDAHVDTLDALLLEGRTMDEGASGGQVNTARLKEGNVGLLVTAMWADQKIRPEGTLHRMLQMTDLFWKTVEAGETFFPVLSRNDLSRVGQESRIGLLLSIEGGEGLVGDLGVLRLFARLGVRLITLTWSNRNELADGIAEEAGGGLTGFGRDVVSEMARLGMVVDLSHISERGFWDALEISPNPPVCSHSNSRAIAPHRRNLSDEQALAIAGKGGVIGLTLCRSFLCSQGTPNLDSLLDHADHLSGLVGTDHLGIGTDFDGLRPQGPPEDIPHSGMMARITEGLIRRGYSEEAVMGILGGNFIRVFDRVLPNQPATGLLPG